MKVLVHQRNPVENVMMHMSTKPLFTHSRSGIALFGELSSRHSARAAIRASVSVVRLGGFTLRWLRDCWRPNIVSSSIYIDFDIRITAEIDLPAQVIFHATITSQIPVLAYDGTPNRARLERGDISS